MAIEIIELLIFKIIVPKRSYKDNLIIYVKQQNKLDLLNYKIEYLKNVYQPEQRTNEWYLFRHNVITASNIWKAFQSEKSFNQLILEKCKPINVDKYNYVNEQSPMHWGQKYEHVSIQYYEYKYNTLVDEFGCIPHKDFTYLAASPDGINTKNDSPLYGRMLEIKNIFNRIINGNPKFEYWIQMQIQMEVCDLNECDFLETRFLEYDNEEEFLNDYYVDIDSSGNFKNNIMMTKDYKYKGMIIAFIIDNKPFYLYSPFACNYDELLLWESDILLLYKDHEFFKNIYYRLDEISCVLVLRNKHWFNCALPIIQDLWQNINETKNDKSKLENLENKCKSSNLKANKNLTKKKCLINNNLFDDCYSLNNDKSIEDISNTKLINFEKKDILNINKIVENNNLSDLETKDNKSNRKRKNSEDIYLSIDTSNI
jgi:putative phage-type endonuclease